MPNPRYNLAVWELLPAPDAKSCWVFGATSEFFQVDLDGKQLRSFVGYDGNIQSNAKVARLAFHPDGKRLISAAGGHVKVWDWASGECLHTFDPIFEAYSLVILPSGTHAISGNGEHRELNVWNLKTLKRTARVGAGATANWLAIDASGTRIISAPNETSGPYNFYGWRLEKFKPVLTRRFEGHTSCIEALTLRADGERVATADMQGRIRLWDAASGKLLHVLEGHPGWVRNLAFLDGDRLLSAGGNHGKLCVWEVSTGKLIREINEVSDATWPGSMALSADGKRVALAGSHRQTLVDLESGSVLKRWELEHVKCLAFVGERLMASIDKGFLKSERLEVKSLPMP